MNTSPHFFSLIEKSRTKNTRLFLKFFFETSNGIFMSFVAVYFANVLHFSKIEILYLLAIIPFFSRLVRPFIYFFLRPKINLITLNFLSLIIIVTGFLIMGIGLEFWSNMIGLTFASIGQGLYRITLRRDLAEDISASDPSALKSVSKFFLSNVVSPVISYPLGFYALNLWPNAGIIYLASILLLPALLPFLIHSNTMKSVENTSDVKWHSVIDARYIKMCILTFFLVCLASSSAFSTPFILYKGGTTIPMVELVAMSISGVIGIFSRKVFRINEKKNVVAAILGFIIAPLLLLYGHLYDINAFRAVAIVMLGFANGVMYPWLLALPNDNRWGGNIEARFFVHSVAMAMGTIFNIIIAVFSFYEIENISSLKIGLVLLSLIAVFTIPLLSKLALRPADNYK